jgi:tyrosyl-tRNA synthetase
MLAREYCDQIKRRFKPIIISHHMLMGLKEGQEKMSKTDVGSAIFMEDSVAEVTSKIKKSYCPPEVVENNPVMDYAKHIVIGYYGKIIINLAEGPVEYADVSLLEADYISGKIHPSQLKPAVTDALNSILEPVRRHFESGEPKALLEKVKKFNVTK